MSDNGNNITIDEEDVVRTTALEPITSGGDIDLQIATAKRFGRSITNFMRDAKSMIELSDEIAGACMYAKPQAGTMIEGPSIRLAEIAVCNWGNIAAGSREVSQDEKSVTIEGACWDLEKNVKISKTIKRQVVYGKNHRKKGQRYPQHMIDTTINAAGSIALRNAVFSVIPRAYIDSLYNHARQVAVGDVKTLPTRRSAMIDHFGKMGVTPEQVLQFLKRPGIDDIDGDDILRLRGIANALKENEMSVDEVFVPVAKPMPPTGGKKKSTSKPKSEDGKIEEPGENKEFTMLEQCYQNLENIDKDDPEVVTIIENNINNVELYLKGKKIKQEEHDEFMKTASDLIAEVSNKQGSLV